MCVAYAREMDLQVGQYSMQSVLWQYIRPTACVGRTRNRGHKRTRYVARRARDARPVSDFADLLQAIHARGDVRRALSHLEHMLGEQGDQAAGVRERGNQRGYWKRRDAYGRRAMPRCRIQDRRWAMGSEETAWRETAVGGGKRRG